jgi:hypothetical protein
MANDTTRRSFTYDAALLLKDAGLVAASAAATVGGSAAAAVMDFGTSYVNGTVVIDLTAVEIDTGNEKYEIIVQGSNSSTFASGIENLASLDLGAASSGRYNAAQDTTTGRYELLFQNVQNDTQYRYVRLYTFVSGTIATGINYKAFVGILPF